jgi:hypothetical protein
VFVVLALAPKFRKLYVVDQALVSHPDVFPVLAVAQGQLGTGISRYVHGTGSIEMVVEE